METPTQKSRSRRVEIRKNCPETSPFNWEAMRASGVLTSLAIAAAFFVVASGILMMRREVIRYRPNQWIPHDIVSRVDFTYSDPHLLAQKEHERREVEPRVYTATGDSWEKLRLELISLPDRVANTPGDKLPDDLAGIFDSGALTALRRASTEAEQPAYER